MGTIFNLHFADGENVVQINQLDAGWFYHDLGAEILWQGSHQAGGRMEQERAQPSCSGKGADSSLCMSRPRAASEEKLHVTLPLVSLAQTSESGRSGAQAKSPCWSARAKGASVPPGLSTSGFLRGNHSLLFLGGSSDFPENGEPVWTVGMSSIPLSAVHRQECDCSVLFSLMNSNLLTLWSFSYTDSDPRSNMSP